MDIFYLINTNNVYLINLKKEYGKEKDYVKIIRFINNLLEEIRIK